MRDYSNYHQSGKDLILSHGQRMFELNKNGFDGADVLVNGEQKRVIFKDKYSAIKSLKKVSDFVGSIGYGDIIEKDGTHWLVMYKDGENAVYEDWIAEECNAYLKWIDDNGVVRSYPCVFYFNTRSNFGVDEDRVMTIPDGRRQVAVQLNKHTAKLQRNNRFIFGSQAFVVIDFDATSDPGLVNLSLKETELSANDNLELGIADYVESNIVLSIVGGDNLSIRAGTVKQLEAVVFKDGEQIDGLSIEWETSDPEIATIDEDGLLTAISNGTITVSAKLKEKPEVTDSIRVVVQLSTQDNLSVTINGPNSMIIGELARFTITVTNNGEIDETKQVQWYLFNQDNKPTDIASFTNKQFTQCYIQANAVGKVKLQAIVVGYPSVFTYKDIEIKYLY